MQSEIVSRRAFLRYSVVAAGAALAACAPAPQSPTAAAPTEAAETAPIATARPEEEAPTQAPAPALQGEVEYFSYDLGPANESRQQIADAFAEANPGTSVKLTFLPYGENWDKLAALMAAGTPPDVIYFDFSLLRYALVGDLLDLSAFFDADPVLNDAGNFLIDMKDPVMARMGTTHLYSLIMGTWVPVLYFNREIFDAAGEQYPDKTWTWETLRPVAKRLTKDDGTQWGLQINNSADLLGWLWWQHQPEDFWAVPQIFPERTVFDSDTGRSCLNFYKNVGAVDKSLVPFAEAGAYEAYGGAFGAGKVAMMTGGDWDAGWGFRELPFAWDMTFLPTVKPDYRPALNCMVSGNVIAGKTKNKELAWALARFMTATVVGQTFVGLGAYETPVLKEAAHSKEVLSPDWAVPGYSTRVEASELPGPMYCPYPLSVNMWEVYDKFWWDNVEKITLGELEPEDLLLTLDDEATAHFQQLLQEMPEVQ